MTARIALATTDAYADEDPDYDTPLLLDALRARGAEADAIVWHDARIDLAGYDLVAIRSTWDYPERGAEFAEWIERVAGVTRLVNSAATVRWNLDKTYLRALAEAGIRTVPTAYCRTADEVRAALAVHDSRRVVVKPAFSAGARDTGLFDAADPGALALAERIMDAGGTAMVQPEVAELSAGAEKALYVIDGRFTHAIAKGALLEVGGGFRGGVYRENPTLVEATSAEQRFAIDVLRAVARVTGEPEPLYARVDVVDSSEYGLVVLEAELIEPALNLHVAPKAVAPVADAVLRVASEARAAHKAGAQAGT